MLMILMEILHLDRNAAPELTPSRNLLPNCIYNYKWNSTAKEIITYNDKKRFRANRKQQQRTNVKQYTNIMYQKLYTQNAA